jgi:hypothetical protein
VLMKRSNKLVEELGLAEFGAANVRKYQRTRAVNSRLILGKGSSGVVAKSLVYGFAVLKHLKPVCLSEAKLVIQSLLKWKEMCDNGFEGIVSFLEILEPVETAGTIQISYVMGQCDSYDHLTHDIDGLVKDMIVVSSTMEKAVPRNHIKTPAL